MEDEFLQSLSSLTRPSAVNMNDPGMDEPIAQATEDADVTFENQRSKEEQDEDDFLDPRYTPTAPVDCRDHFSNSF